MPYFDHNATAPLRPVARDAWLEAQEQAWQNPASAYRGAAQVKLRGEVARERLAPLLGCDAKDLLFTSGATEAALAVLGHLARVLPADACLALNPTEHTAVLAAAKSTWDPGRLVWLPVDAAGVVSVSAFLDTLNHARLGAVAVMAANNETGVLQPWRELAQVARSRGFTCVCDATQWLGKLPAAGLGEVDWVFGSAHKFGGPKGVGVLKLPGAQTPAAAHARSFSIGPGSATQQRGYRAGTEDYPGAAALVAALVEAETKFVLWESERLRWRDHFVRAIDEFLPGGRVLGAEAERLWNTVALLLPHGDQTRWVARLDKRGFQVAAGAACAAVGSGPSPTLTALGLAPEEARRVVRISSGWTTTEDEWRALAGAMREVAPEVMPAAGVVPG